MWPQYTILGLNAFAVISCVAKRKGPFETLVAPAIGLWLLFEGGFFAGLGFAP